MVSPIEFSLFAPRVEKVALIGSFSDWQETPMTKGEDGYYRASVELEDGVYQYKFRVLSKTEYLHGQWLDVNDPYATEIDLNTQNGVMRVKDGEKVSTFYEWQHDDKPLPANEELVIYEMHIADFVGEIGGVTLGEYFLAAIAKLDYLVELGINAIELMPVTEYTGNYRWGYLVRYFFAPESSYGNPEDLKKFIDECHARGIRVLIDGIYNHSDGESPLLKIDRDYWYYHDMHYPDDPDNFWGPEFNYDGYDETLDIKPAWKFIGDVVRYWVQEYHIDGIRYDAIRQLGNYDFLFWLTQEATKAAGNKPFYNIAEHIPEAICVTEPDGPFEGCWHESFRIFAIEHICSDRFDLAKLKEALDGKFQGFAGATSVVNYLASHDRERTLTELGDRGIFDQAAFQRAKLGAVLLMTAMGLPMIWMGDEFGEYKRKTETTTQPNKLQWHLLEQDFNQDLLKYYQKLIALRKKILALQTSNVNFFYEHIENQILAYVRWNDMGSRVVVVANFSDQSFPEYQIPQFPEDGNWYEWLNDRQYQVENACLTTELKDFAAKVFIYQP
ncbi:alpha amylase C-terminal domain-containing protein [Trichocoleus sp. FACHB-591]|uniref:alpha-amylase family glycosyl hydrolase n=1 Tax=Trichocoleus sp. FACHB-591 TaxID=2692872 RepID=UPI0016823C10|nr:alpha-amylase family glycosyl hydrolase [Trichocoleus sp. FACHB-591]MBD2096851.1 alpha amylase C-terminal domain-containing protein [Trichocoleus sp. FACHB-591]